MFEYTYFLHGISLSVSFLNLGKNWVSMVVYGKGRA